MSSTRKSILLYAVADILCFGAGMGVPVFCILLGVPVGWIAAGRALDHSSALNSVLARVLRVSTWTSSLTLALCAIVWLPALRWLLDPARDISQFGHPLILYSPLASFIGWLVLMVIISPVLQFIVTVSSAVINLWSLSRKRSV